MSQEKDLDKYAQALQEQILEQALKEYSEPVIERWQNPRNMGTIENPDGYGKVTGTCGDTIEIYLKMEGEVISSSAFRTNGCGATLACGSMVTEIVQGRTLTQALAKVSAAEILHRLGGLPEGNIHCAQLASETMRHALADYLQQRRSSWKKSYRKT